MEDNGELARHKMWPSNEGVDTRWRTAHFQLVRIEAFVREIQYCAVRTEVLDELHESTVLSISAWADVVCYCNVRDTPARVNTVRISFHESLEVRHTET